MKKVLLCVLGAVVGYYVFRSGSGYIGTLWNRTAGFSPADWALVGGIGLFLVSCVLYRIFVGPPVVEKEEEKGEEEKEFWERFEDLTNPAYPLRQSSEEDIWGHWN